MTALRRVIVEWWALISVIGGGLICWGMFSARLDAAESTISTLKTDHDILIEVKTKVEAIDKKLDKLTDRAQ